VFGAHSRSTVKKIVKIPTMREIAPPDLTARRSIG
jgi:hypothetical protein